ncbi:MAG: hypothetical protein MJ174_02880 [Treponema sp.]|nr:hypothetical protein [Treponema sp.]
MRQKIKLKPKIKIFSKADLLFFYITILFGSFLVIFGLFMFFKGFNVSLTKNDEEPIARISDKIRTSRRCFEDRTVWDRLQKDSLIYNGDTIRTDDDSQATLIFDEEKFGQGLVLTLDSNTMTQIKMDKTKELQIMFTEGDILINSENNLKPATVVYNNTSISMTGKAKISTYDADPVEFENLGKNQKVEKKLELQVLDGNAKIKAAGNEEINVQNGEAVTVKSKTGRRASDNKTEISAPEKIQEGSPAIKNKQKIKEQTNSEKLSPIATNVSFYQDQDISQTIEQGKVVRTKKEPVVEKQNQPQKKEKETVQSKQKEKTTEKTKKSEEKKTAALKSTSLKQPIKNKVFNDSYFEKNSSIDFNWFNIKEATNYKFTIKNPKGKIVFQQTLGKEASFKFTDFSILSEGTFTWSVQPLQMDKKGDVIASGSPESSTFIVKLGTISGDTTETGELYGHKKK